MDHRLIIYQEAESTQDIAKVMALSGEPEGLAVMALNQTQGRGRSGRDWTSPPGKNLALSLILRPRIPAQELPLLGLLVGVAVAETVEAYGIPRAELRWPNDVLISGKKVAGILLEAGMLSNSARFVIVGVGLNVNSTASDFPPDLRESVTSLLMCTARQWDLEEAARKFLEHMETMYCRVYNEGPRFIPALWSARWAHQGRMLVSNGLIGVGQGINEDGSLILKTGEGQMQLVTSGIVEPI